MPRLTRKNIKVFAGSATNNGVFGSLQANNPTTTSDVEQLQSLSAWSDGWNAATETSEELPPLEEIQGVEYVTTYQQAYIMQEGVPEWAATVTYYKGCLTKEVTSTGFKIYNSLTDNNTGNLLSDTSNWKKVMDSDDLYAFDNTVVHKTGNETITGTKTFTGTQYLSPYTIITKGNGSGGNDEGGELEFEVGSNSDLQDNVKLDVYKNSMRIFGTDSNDNARVIIDANIEENKVKVPTPATSSNDNTAATTAWVNTVGNNVVHLAGSETITGIKTILNTIEKKATWDSTQTPSVLVVSDAIRFKDSNDVMCGLVTSTKNTDGVLSTVIDCRKGNLFSQVRVCIDNNNNIFATAPGSDKANSIVTTEGINKGANGYVKLGNGIIIQWGDGYSNPVTFPTPFSAIAVVTGSPTHNGRTQNGHGYVWNVTTTSFEYRCDNDMLPYRWIAVGF